MPIRYLSGNEFRGVGEAEDTQHRNGKKKRNSKAGKTEDRNQKKIW